MLGWRQISCVVAICASVLAACDATPTLPLPPPTARVSAPNSRGLVTIEGTAKSRALVFVYNEETEDGSIGRADEVGSYVLAIEARSDDVLTLWQNSGGQDGEPRTLLVP